MRIACANLYATFSCKKMVYIDALVVVFLHGDIRYLSQETLRNPTKSAEIPRGIRKASVQLSAE